MRIGTRALVALVWVVTLLAHTASPASANVVNLTFTSGSIDSWVVFDHPWNTPDGIIPLTSVCSSGHALTTTQTVAGPPSQGTVSLVLDAVLLAAGPHTAGYDHIVTIDETETGTYIGNNMSLPDAEIELTIRRRAGTTGCVTDALAGTCNLTATNVDLFGVVTGGLLPTLASGGTGVITGNNADFETTVSGSGSACGGFAGGDLGVLVFESATFEVL